MRARAREAGLAYELLASRADLQAIVAAQRAGGEEADVRTLHGWRRELVGSELLELLDGRVSLSVSKDGHAHRLQMLGVVPQQARASVRRDAMFRLFDAVIDFEQRQVHRDHDEPDHRRRSR